MESDRLMDSKIDGDTLNLHLKILPKLYQSHPARLVHLLLVGGILFDTLPEIIDKRPFPEILTLGRSVAIILLPS